MGQSSGHLCVEMAYDGMADVGIGFGWRRRDIVQWMYGIEIVRDEIRLVMVKSKGRDGMRSANADHDATSTYLYSLQSIVEATLDLSPS